MSEGNVAADQLRLLIERIERLEEEKKGISDDIKDIYLEAKATGYDAKIIRQIIRLRKMEPHHRQEMQAVLETYLSALGMDDGPGRQQDMYEGHDGRPDPATPAPAPTATDAEMFETALSLVIEHQNASTSWLQRQMRIGYNQAARLVEDLEKRGVVGPPNNVGKRDILIAPGGDVQASLKKLRDLCAKSDTSMSMSVNGGPLVPIVTRASERA